MREMSEVFFLNGKKVTQGGPGESEFFAMAHNSAFYWGESVFTTFLMEEGGYFFLEDHWKRVSLARRWQWGGGEGESSCPPQELLTCLREQQGAGRKRVRLTFFLQGDLEGEKREHWLLRFSPATSQKAEAPLKLKCLAHPHLAWQRPSQVKVGNYSECLRLYRQGRCEGFDDILFWVLDEGKEEIYETVFRNIFFFKDDEIFTPPQRKGMLSGITRRHFIHCLKSRGIKVQERSCLLSWAMSAQGALLTSSVAGLACVGKLGEQSYSNGNWPLEKYGRDWQEYRLMHKTVLK